MTVTLVRETIERLPDGCFFRPKDLPGKSGTARAVLAKDYSDPGGDVRRVAPGFYWKGRQRTSPWPVPVALAYAGEGAGQAEWTAVHELGWAHQGSRHSCIAVLERRLQPTHPTVRFVTRRSPERRRLTWAEVSVLEALPWMRYVEYPWETCLEMVARGYSGACVSCGHPQQGVIRPAVLAWAAETDQFATEETCRMAAEMHEHLPETVMPVRSPIAA